MNIISKLWHDHYMNFVRERTANNGLILDVGSGKTPVYASNFCLDLYSPRDVKASAECLPFRDCYFDTVFCLEVIEHLPNPIKFIGEAKRVLKPSGKLVLTTPNCNMLWNLVWFLWNHTVAKNWALNRHIHKFTQVDLLNMIWTKANYFSRINLVLYYLEVYK